MSAIEIRKARAADREAIETLLTNSWLDHWAPHVTAKSVASFDAEKPVATYLDAYLDALDVLTSDGAIAGVAHVDGDMLLALHVETGRIGSGFGKALLAHAQSQGANRLEVRAFNAQARRFYVSQGWRETKRYLASEMGTPTVTLEMVRS